MADIERISAQQAHAKTGSKQALLVCAYEDEAKCRMLNLDGSITQNSGFILVLTPASTGVSSSSIDFPLRGL